MKMFSPTRPLLAAAVLVALTWPAIGQQKTIVLRAARMFDGRQMRTPGLAVVTDSRILGVGPGASFIAMNVSIDSARPDDVE
jgi:hypothetical protein